VAKLLCHNTTSSLARKALKVDFFQEITDQVDTATASDIISEGIRLNSTVEFLGKFREQVISTFNSPFSWGGLGGGALLSSVFLVGRRLPSISHLP